MGLGLHERAASSLGHSRQLEDALTVLRSRGRNGVRRAVPWPEEYKCSPCSVFGSMILLLRETALVLSVFEREVARRDVGVNERNP